MSTETKIITGVIALTVVIIIGAVFLFSKPEPKVNDDQVITRNGLHWHPKVEIYIKNKKQEIPADLGLGAVHQKIHTHAKDSKEGVVHIEISGIALKEDTKLGKFFAVWGKKINFAGKPKMTVNGKENTELENYLMKDNDKIVIRYE